MISWLRDFTDLPLGVYPNLGHLAGARWRFDDTIGPDGVRGARARVARGGRADHRRLLRRRRPSTSPRSRARARRHEARPHARPALADAALERELPREARAEPWLDERGARPLPAAVSRARDRAGRLRARPRAATSSGSTSSRRASARASAASTSAAARGILTRAARAQRRRRTCTRSTSTATRSPTRSRTRSATASPIASPARTSTSTSGSRSERFDVDRREPLPDARRPVRGADAATARSTTGAATCSTTSSACCRGCSAADGGALRHAALDRRPGETARGCSREQGLQARVVDFSFFPFGPLFEQQRASRSSASSSSPTRTISPSATRTSWSRTCSRSAVSRTGSMAGASENIELKAVDPDPAASERACRALGARDGGLLPSATRTSPSSAGCSSCARTSSAGSAS